MKTPSGRRSTGVREAKAHLSRMLADVRSGHEWTITARGTPVARLVPVSRKARPLEERLSLLEARGVLQPASPSARPLPPPLPVEPGLARRLLEDDRGE
jgi:prevent-host-death family protein